MRAFLFGPEVRCRANACKVSNLFSATSMNRESWLPYQVHQDHQSALAELKERFGEDSDVEKALRRSGSLCCLICSLSRSCHARTPLPGIVEAVNIEILYAGLVSRACRTRVVGTQSWPDTFARRSTMCRRQRSGCGSRLSGVQSSSQKGNSLRLNSPIVINTPESAHCFPIARYCLICPCRV